MAADAVASKGGVIHKRDDGPVGRDMTVRTLTVCRDVIGWF